MPPGQWSDPKSPGTIGFNMSPLPFMIIQLRLISEYRLCQTFLYTLSGLIKTVAKEGKCFLFSGEIFDNLNKLLKTEDDGNGEVQFLCQMFSGEKTSYR